MDTFSRLLGKQVNTYLAVFIVVLVSSAFTLSIVDASISAVIETTLGTSVQQSDLLIQSLKRHLPERSTKAETLRIQPAR